jgi:radical SAM-linked protein
MQSEPMESAPTAPSAVASPPTRSKYRVRFRKAGDLRLVSHHDLMHCFERMFRRAKLPVPSTQGFNPRPRLWFAQSLALGVIGLNEVLELELNEPLPPEELQRRLVDQCPPGLAILTVRSIDIRASAHVRRAHFRLALTQPAADLSGRCGLFLAAEHYWVERTRPQPRRLDIRPFVRTLIARDGVLEMALWVTPYGAVRPDEVVQALGLPGIVESGAVLERTDLELADEAGDDEPLPAGLPMQPSTKEPLPRETGDRTRDRTQAAAPTPILTGPMSFDS